ncbi:hypothetical protein EVAR_67662_1 [Eumeta japonica]|uniref:Uncharacterized protein n=1 Tax=Eumeta variegata TaxID=151549 RepID=A0A4C1ZA69_EUMVA|nr:hypothetical protein EVAR_67662_1 [Eumeta japonica]
MQDQGVRVAGGAAGEEHDSDAFDRKHLSYLTGRFFRAPCVIARRNVAVATHGHKGSSKAQCARRRRARSPGGIGAGASAEGASTPRAGTETHAIT